MVWRLLIRMLAPIQLGKSHCVTGVPPTWQPPCPGGSHTLKVLERRNGGDDSSDEDFEQCSSAPLPLIHAAKNDDYAQLESLLSNGRATHLIDSRDQSGATALTWAARHGNVKSVSLLLARNSSVDAADAMRWTPLMEASFSKAPAVVRALLAASANPRLENRGYENALSVARDVKSAACIDLLAATLSREEALIDCAKSGDVQRMNQLLDAAESGSGGGIELLASASYMLRSQVCPSYIPSPPFCAHKCVLPASHLPPLTSYFLPLATWHPRSATTTPSAARHCTGRLPTVRHAGTVRTLVAIPPRGFSASPAASLPSALCAHASLPTPLSAPLFPRLSCSPRGRLGLTPHPSAVACIEALLERGCQVDAAGAGGWTPLMCVRWSRSLRPLAPFDLSIPWASGAQPALLPTRLANPQVDTAPAHACNLPCISLAQVGGE